MLPLSLILIFASALLFQTSSIYAFPECERPKQTTPSLISALSRRQEAYSAAHQSDSVLYKAEGDAMSSRLHGVMNRWLYFLFSYYKLDPVISFEVFTVAISKILAFWIVTTCSFVNGYRRFRETLCLHLHGWRALFKSHDASLHLPDIKNLLLNLHTSTLKMKSACFSEIWISIHKTVRLHKPEDHNFKFRLLSLFRFRIGEQQKNHGSNRVSSRAPSRASQGCNIFIFTGQSNTCGHVPNDIWNRDPSFRGSEIVCDLWLYS
jgi:hypothetical protein